MVFFYDGRLSDGAPLLSATTCGGCVSPTPPTPCSEAGDETQGSSEGTAMRQEGTAPGGSAGCWAAQGAHCGRDWAVLPSPRAGAGAGSGAGRGGAAPPGPGPSSGRSPSRGSHGRGLREGAHRPSRARRCGAVPAPRECCRQAPGGTGWDRHKACGEELGWNGTRRVGTGRDGTGWFGTVGNGWGRDRSRCNGTDRDKTGQVGSGPAGSLPAPTRALHRRMRRPRPPGPGGC